MDDKAWELLLEKINTIEIDVKDIKREMTTLKIKVASISSVIGALAVLIKDYFHS